MWIFDSKGKRIGATQEDARQMIAEGGGFSALWPRGTPAQEAAEFEALCKDSSPADALLRAARRQDGPPEPKVPTPVAAPTTARTRRG